MAVILKANHQFIGWAGIKYVTEKEDNKTNFYDLGYRLMPEYWGQGYGHEAAKAVLDYGFMHLNIQLIYASVDENHKASKRILEKIGMIYTHTFPNDNKMWASYELAKEDYIKKFQHHK